MSTFNKQHPTGMLGKLQPPRPPASSTSPQEWSTGQILLNVEVTRVTEFQAGPTLQSSAFVPFTQPQFGNPVFYTDLPNGAQDSDYAYSTSSDISQHVLADRAASYPGAALPSVSVVTLLTPNGRQDTPVEFWLETTSDLLAPPPVAFSVQFGLAMVSASVVSYTEGENNTKQYILSCQAPSFPSTGCRRLSDIPVHVIMDTGAKGTLPARVAAEPFNYTLGESAASSKRKASDGSEFDIFPPSKRSFNGELSLQNRGSEPLDYDQNSPYSTMVPTPTGSAFFPSMPRTSSPRQAGHHYSTSTASQASLTAPSPHTPGYSPSFMTVKSEVSPRLPVTPNARPASAVPQDKVAPRLVRTSTIQQSPPQAHASSAIHTQSFNPYGMYPHKANLKLIGDLDSVAKVWTDDQRNASRKLIEFTREQVNSTIHATFKTVTPEERSPANITVSCIRWEGRDECFVTSVDTIYLLESLISVRFTVEEKNRIRRNLEGFRPLTVSKAKLDSEDFFKTIMGFPHPKPRNIEKDVKVFPWKVLSQALKKIIGKYSASYASTASRMAPAPPTYVSQEEAGDYVSYHQPMPVPAPMLHYPVVTSAGYAQSMATEGHTIPATIAPYSDLRLQVPVSVPIYELPHNVGYQPMPLAPHSHALTPQIMSAPPTGRMQPSWEYSSFVNDSPVTTSGPHSASIVYPRTTGIDSAEFFTPAAYHHHR